MQTLLLAELSIPVTRYVLIYSAAEPSRAKLQQVRQQRLQQQKQQQRLANEQRLRKMALASALLKHKDALKADMMRKRSRMEKMLTQQVQVRQSRINADVMCSAFIHVLFSG